MRPDAPGWAQRAVRRSGRSPKRDLGWAVTARARAHGNAARRRRQVPAARLPARQPQLDGVQLEPGPQRHPRRRGECAHARRPVLVSFLAAARRSPSHRALGARQAQTRACERFASAWTPRRGRRGGPAAGRITCARVGGAFAVAQMGLGKTVQCVSFLGYLSESQHVRCARGNERAAGGGGSAARKSRALPAWPRGPAFVPFTRDGRHVPRARPCAPSWRWRCPLASPVPVPAQRCCGIRAVRRARRGPFLVVVPLSTVPNWVREFRRWTPQASAVFPAPCPPLRPQPPAARPTIAAAAGRQAGSE